MTLCSSEFTLFARFCPQQVEHVSSEERQGVPVHTHTHTHNIMTTPLLGGVNSPGEYILQVVVPEIDSRLSSYWSTMYSGGYAHIHTHTYNSEQAKLINSYWHLRPGREVLCQHIWPSVQHPCMTNGCWQSHSPEQREDAKELK